MRNIINSVTKHLVGAAGATAVTAVFAWTFIYSTQTFPVY